MNPLDPSPSSPNSKSPPVLHSRDAETLERSRSLTSRVCAATALLLLLEHRWTKDCRLVARCTRRCQTKVPTAATPIAASERDGGR